MYWYLEVLKKYAVFSGRARRKEYWMFALFNFIFAILALTLDGLASTSFSYIFGLFYLAYVLALLIPGLAVLVRRLHDTGRSGGWFFIAFIPLVGSIWLLVLMILEGDRGANVYGPDPKEIISE